MKQTIVFDLGGVLIDWNPRHFFKTVFDKEAEMEYFLHNICTNDWNELQDAGRSLKDATDILVRHFPDYESLIRMYYGEWRKMLHGAIPGTVDILSKLKSNDHRILALTNWSQEPFPVAKEIFEFLGWFEDILVSGEEKLKKPVPAIFNLLIRRYQLEPAKSIFIDDNLRNVVAALEVGLDAIHFVSPEILVSELNKRGIVI